MLMSLEPLDTADTSSLPPESMCPAWVRRILSESDFSSDERRQSLDDTSRIVTNPSERETILFSSMLGALDCLTLTAQSITNYKTFIPGMAYLFHRLLVLFSASAEDQPKDASRLQVQAPSLNDLRLKRVIRKVPGHLLANYATALAAMKRIGDRFKAQLDECLDAMYGTKEAALTAWAAWRVMKDRLIRNADRDVNEIMARRGVTTDPGFDPAWLVFALFTRNTLRHPERDDMQAEPIMRAAVDTVSQQGIQADGTWPVGWSSKGQRSDLIQQVSVECSHALAEFLLAEDMQYCYPDEHIELFEGALPALRCHANLLRRTYRPNAGGPSEGVRCHGWAGDRVRSNSTYAESWITAFVARFFHKLSLLEAAHRRQNLLVRLKARPASAIRGDAKPWSKERWWQDIIEQDYDQCPMNVIFDDFVKPVSEAAATEDWSCLPLRACSFILYGPPGSGKTHFVKCLSRALRWPLIELTPGHFIGQGIESIESSADRIFRKLHGLEHAVVFFDECDELFLTRDVTSTESPQRNILSFVTASMLPKVQRLHDRGHVIFIVATNFLQRIDQAIRRPGRFDARILCDRMDATARMVAIVDAAVRRHRSGRPNEGRLGWVDSLLQALPHADSAEKLAGIRRAQGDRDPNKVRAAIQSWCGSHVADLDSMSRECAGFTYPSIERFVENPNVISSLVQTSGVKDWIDWWMKHGRRELVEAGVGPEARIERIIGRAQAAAEAYNVDWLERAEAVRGQDRTKSTGRSILPRPATRYRRGEPNG